MIHLLERQFFKNQSLFKTELSVKENHFVWPSYWVHCSPEQMFYGGLPESLTSFMNLYFLIVLPQWHICFPHSIKLSSDCIWDMQKTHNFDVQVKLICQTVKLNEELNHCVQSSQFCCKWSRSRMGDSRPTEWTIHRYIVKKRYRLNYMHYQIQNLCSVLNKKLLRSNFGIFSIRI